MKIGQFVCQDCGKVISYHRARRHKNHCDGAGKKVGDRRMTRQRVRDSMKQIRRGMRL